MSAGAPVGALVCAAALALAAPEPPPAPLWGPYLVGTPSGSLETCRRASLEEAVLCRPEAGKALPPPGKPLRLAAFGDSGSGEENQLKVARLLERLSPDLALVLGDVIYPAGEERDYAAKFFDPYRASLTKVAFAPVVGNHDYGDDHTSAANGQKRFDSGFARAFRRPKYYSFDAGDAHFSMLDTNRAYGIPAAESIVEDSEQLAWLRRDLAASKARWKIVCMHVPVYSSGRHGSSPELQKALQPVFAEHGVDLVLEGHEHDYERSRPLRGTVYVVAGTGGAGLYPVDPSKPWVAKAFSRHGLVSIRLDRTSLRLEMLGTDGSTLDSLALNKP